MYDSGAPRSREDSRILKKALRIAAATPTFSAGIKLVEAACRAEAAKHWHSGELAGSIKSKRVRTKRGIRDGLVYSTDPEFLAKEVGHMARPREEGNEGKRRRKKGTPMSFVPGIHVFLRVQREFGG